MSYKETNCILANRLIGLTDFIKKIPFENKLVLVDFYEEQIKRHIDTYALVYFTDSGSFDFDIEEVNAAFVIWNGEAFEDTSDIEKESFVKEFVKEYGFYKFKWFYPEKEVEFYDSNKINT